MPVRLTSHSTLKGLSSASIGPLRSYMEPLLWVDQSVCHGLLSEIDLCRMVRMVFSFFFLQRDEISLLSKGLNEVSVMMSSKED